MRTHAAHNERVRVVATPNVANLLLADLRARAVIQRVRIIALVVALAYGEPDLPFLRKAIGRKAARPILEFEALLALEVTRQTCTEHPVVPGIPHLRGGARWGGVADRQIPGDWRLRREAHQAKPDRLPHAATNVVLRVRRAGCPAQRIHGSREALETDERQRVLLPASRPLRRNEDMHLCELAVAHPVHERDFGAVVVEIAEGVGTIEKHPHGRVLRRAGAILRVEWRNSKGTCSGHRSEE